MPESRQSITSRDCESELYVEKTDTEKKHARNEDEKKISGEELLYRVDESPPWQACLLFGLQQLMLCLGSLATFPRIMMKVLCADDSDSVTDYRTSMIGTCLFVAGASTFLQTTFGLRLPVLQGTILAYLISASAVLSSEEWKCPEKLDLRQNLSFDNTYTVYVKNSSVFIHDVESNSTISVLNHSKYYRDNDGVIRNSNEVWFRRMNEIQGGVIFCALVQLLLGITGSMGFLLRFIGPLTIAPTMSMVTYGTIDIVVDLCGNQWGIAISVVALFFISSICMGRVMVPIPRCARHEKRWHCTSTRLPLFSMFPVICSISIVWILCYIITKAGGFSDDPNDPSYKARTDSHTGAIEKSPWFRMPYPFQYGLPTFSVSTSLGMMAAVLPGILESIGDYNATAVVSKENPPPKHAVNRGIFMEGVGITLSAIFGTGNATTSWSPNIIVIGISRVASRRIFQYVGFMLMFLGVFSKVLSIFSTLPIVVVGGVMCATTGMVMAVGVATLKHVDMSLNRNLFVFGFSIFFGMVLSKFVSQNPDSVKVGINELDNTFLVLLRSPMFLSGMTGFLLDNIAPGSRKARGLETFYANRSSEGTKKEKADVYDLPFKTNWKWTKYIPICPLFKSDNQ